MLSQIFHTYQKGLQYAWTLRRASITIYLLTLGAALFLILPMMSVFDAALGQSLELESLLNAPNHRIITDFLNHHLESLMPIIGQLKYVLPLYVLLQVLWNGGLLVLFNREKVEWSASRFWGGGVKWFRKMLVLALVFLILHALLAVVIYGLLYVRVSNMELANEQVLIKMVMLAVAVHFVLGSMLSMWQDYAKVALIKRGKLWFALTQAFRKSFGNFLRFYGLYLLNVLIIGALFSISFKLDPWLSPSSLGGVIFLTILQQAFIFLRIFARITNLSSVWEMCSLH